MKTSRPLQTFASFAVEVFERTPKNLTAKDAKGFAKGRKGEHRRD
jgi:hypothetical protein